MAAPPFPSTPPLFLPSFGFKDFLHIFVLGDTSRLLASSPKGAASFVGEDPVKTTMLLQAIRRLPLLTTIPLAVTTVLFTVAVIKVLLPLLAPMLHEAEAGVVERVRREVEESWVDHIVDYLEEGLGEEGEDGKGVDKLVALGERIVRVVDVVVDMMPNIGTCAGSLIGCHVRLRFVGTACLPFGVLTACSALLGTAAARALAAAQPPG